MPKKTNEEVSRWACGPLTPDNLDAQCFGVRHGPSFGPSTTSQKAWFTMQQRAQIRSTLMVWITWALWLCSGRDSSNQVMYKSPLPLAKFFVGAATMVRLKRGVQTESSAVPRGSASLISGKCVHCRRLDLPSHLRLTIRGRGQRLSIQPRCREQCLFTAPREFLPIPNSSSPKLLDRGSTWPSWLSSASWVALGKLATRTLPASMCSNLGWMADPGVLPICNTKSRIDDICNTIQAVTTTGTLQTTAVYWRAGRLTCSSAQLFGKT